MPSERHVRFTCEKILLNLHTSVYQSSVRSIQLQYIDEHIEY